MENEKVIPFEFETEAQHPLPTTIKEPSSKKKSSKSLSLSRQNILKSLVILFSVAMLGFFIFLLVEFIRDKVDENRKMESTESIRFLNNVAEARSYFETKKQQNSLLKSATWSNDYVSLEFEATKEIVRLSRNIVSTLQTNSDTWMASIAYMDATTQLFPFSGNEKFFDVVDSSSNVVLNPYSICPLTAEIKFTTPVQGKVKLTISGRTSSSHDLVHQFNELTTSHVVPVIGLYENFNNLITLAFTDTYGTVRASKQLSIQTGAALPNDYQIDIKKALDSSLGPQFIFIFYINYERVVYDEQGYIRWYLRDSSNTLPSIGSSKMAWVFPLTQGVVSFFAPSGSFDARVYLANMLGKISSSFYVPNGVHHEIIEKTQGGNLLVSTGLNPAYEEIIEEWDRETLTVVKTWNLEDYFDKNRQQCATHPTLIKSWDWMHFNSIEYDPKDNTILISSRNQCFFGKIGYDDGKVKFIAGSHRDWNAPYSDYLLTPTNFDTSLAADKDYTYYQHTAILRANGNYLIYDNGGDRPGYSNTPSDLIQSLVNKDYPSIVYGSTTVPPGYARAVEFKVDYDKKTISKIWEHTDFPTLSTSVWGSVKEIDDNYIMIGYGELGAVSLVDRANSKQVFSAVTPYFYRAIPIDLYAGY